MCWAGRVGAFPHVRPPPLREASNPSVSTHPRSCAAAAQGLLQTTLTDAGGAGGGGGGGGLAGTQRPASRVGVSSWRAVLAEWRRQGACVPGVCALQRRGRALYGPRSAPQDLARPRVLYGMVSDNAQVTLFDCLSTRLSGDASNYGHPKRIHEQPCVRRSRWQGEPATRRVPRHLQREHRHLARRRRGGGVAWVGRCVGGGGGGGVGWGGYVSK